MDPKDDSTGLDQIHRLLALCARAEGHAAFYSELIHQLSNFNTWDELPAQAELHGMAPLLWHHIQKSGFTIPKNTEQTLKALYLRSRAYNQIHERVLMEIITLFNEAGIQPLLLKGLALAYQYYPDPALRPVSDIDLLLKKEDFLPAVHLLEDAKFDIQFPHASKSLQKSATATALREGILAHIELHHYDPEVKYEKGNNPDPEFAGLDSQPQAIKINGGIIYTSGPTETFLYLTRHFTKHLFIGNPGKPAQFKWIADITSLVEHHAEELDWELLRQTHPEMIYQLEVFYSFTPPPEHLAKIIPIRKIPPPKGLGQYPPGWPHQSIRQWKQTGFLRFIWQVLIPPSDWWTRVYYGISEQSLFWHKQVIYRTQILTAIFWVAAHKTGF